MKAANTVEEALKRLRRKYVMCNGVVTYQNMREFHFVRRETIMECIEAISGQTVFPQPDFDGPAY